MAILFVFHRLKSIKKVIWHNDEQGRSNLIGQNFRRLQFPKLKIRKCLIRML